MTALGDRVLGDTRAFHRLLTADNVASLRLARNLFHASMWVPCALYYGLPFLPKAWARLAVDQTPKFPATISFTIRKGVTKLVQHTLWACGWLVMLKTVLMDARGATTRARVFLAQMFATGVVSVVLCPLGLSRTTDAIHFATAGLYMADHEIMCGLYRVPARFIIGFRAGLVGLFASLLLLRGTERAERLPHSEQGHDDDREAALVGKPRRVRAQVHLADTAVMVCEYGLFISFISGMTAGLGKRGGGGGGGGAIRR